MKLEVINQRKIDLIKDWLTEKIDTSDRPLTKMRGKKSDDSISIIRNKENSIDIQRILSEYYKPCYECTYIQQIR